MKDWKLIAAGFDLRIPDAELARVAGTLEALETVFRPLVRAIPETVEPAPVYRADEKEEA